MNAHELFMLRNEFLKMCTILSPQLLEEFEKMQKTYEENCQKVAVIEAAGWSEKQKAEADKYVADCQAKADIFLTKAKETNDKATTEREELAELRKEATAFRDAAKDAAEEGAKKLAGLAAQTASVSAAQAQAQKVIDDRREAVRNRELEMDRREKDLANRVLRMKELVA